MGCAARKLFCDGRQSRRFLRQPLLGIRAAQHSHRCAGHDLSFRGRAESPGRNAHRCLGAGPLDGTLHRLCELLDSSQPRPLEAPLSLFLVGALLAAPSTERITHHPKLNCIIFRTIRNLGHSECATSTPASTSLSPIRPNKKSPASPRALSLAESSAESARSAHYFRSI